MCMYVHAYVCVRESEVNLSKISVKSHVTDHTYAYDLNTHI